MSILYHGEDTFLDFGGKPNVPAPRYCVECMFEDGEIRSNDYTALYFSGIRNDRGDRPISISITALGSQENYTKEPKLAERIGAAKHVLKTGFNVLSNIYLHPAWFDELVKGK